MAQRQGLANIDLHLVKVLHTVISERSVSRAAMRLQSTQPMVSAQLKRLRELTGDPLLVRSGQGLAPTDAALAMLEPASRLLREAELLFAPRQRSGPFDAAHSELTFRIAASDYLDPMFLPGIVEMLKAEAPRTHLDIHPLSAEFDYRRKLAAGEVDLVIGNWLKPPEELHLGRLDQRRGRLPGGRRPPGSDAAAAAGAPSATCKASMSRRWRCMPVRRASSTSTWPRRGWSATSWCAARISA